MDAAQGGRISRIAEGPVGLDAVVVAAADAGHGQVAGLLEVSHDVPAGAFGDAEVAAMSRSRTLGLRAMWISTRA